MENRKIHTEVWRKAPDVPTPKEIVSYLDRYVVGQDRAKRELAVAVYNHYRRTESGRCDDGVERSKSCLFLGGPSGSGKTYLVQCISRLLNVPFVSVDATSFSEASFKGDNVADIARKLWTASGHNKAVAERGIVFIDELGKTAVTGVGGVTDSARQSVQFAFLKIIEGAEYSVSSMRSSTDTISTANVLFIAADACTGLSDIVKRRLSGRTIGFDSGASEVPDDSGELLERVTSDDLISFGFVPELVGRIPVFVPLSPLGTDALMKILTQPKNALLKQYGSMLADEGFELEVTPEAVRAIAEKAAGSETGARGLRGVVEPIMTQVMYEVPSLGWSAGKVIISADCVDGRAAPEFVRAPSRDQ